MNSGIKKKNFISSIHILKKKWPRLWIWNDKKLANCSSYLLGCYIKTNWICVVHRWRTGNCWQKSDNIPSLSRNNSTPYSHIWKNFCNVFKRILNFICLWWNNCEISSASPHNVVKSPFLVRISNAYKIVLSFQFFFWKNLKTLYNFRTIGFACLNPI